MHKYFQASPTAQILVVGDVILDRYLYGETTRISPEAPVPVVKVKKTVDKPGGAANVALNIKSLGIEVQLIGITGEDDSAEQLATQLASEGVSYQFIHQEGFPTVTKLRVLSQNQQLLRLDYESDSTFTGSGALYQIYSEVLNHVDAVVLSDYAKGSLQSTREFINLARQNNIRVLVHPKGEDFTRYQNASIMVPNLLEFEAVVGVCRDEQELVEKGVSLSHSLALDALCIIRGRDGMTFINVQEENILQFPAINREVFDVTGAGDTAIATLAAAIGSGYELEQAVEFSNRAVGIVLKKLGTAVVGINELNSIDSLPVKGDGYGIDAIGILLEEIAEFRRQGEKIVLLNGCFNRLDAELVEYLQKARGLGDRLIVAVYDDNSVRSMHGRDYPVYALQKRMQVLAGLSSTDLISAVTTESAAGLINKIKPDVFVLASDSSQAELADADNRMDI